MPFLQRIRIYIDLKSHYKSIWLTGYCLITWGFWDGWDTVWETFDVTFYEGDYE